MTFEDYVKIAREHNPVPSPKPKVKGPKIKTQCICPPIPLRSFDWMAYDDDTYGGDPGDMAGYGPTEQDAIADLMSQIEERLEDER